jgi:G3E family GTPase
MTPLLESQVSEVDEIIISKVDEASVQEIERAEAVIRRLNPQAPVHRVSAFDQAALAPLVEHLLFSRETRV